MPTLTPGKNDSDRRHRQEGDAFYRCRIDANAGMVGDVEAGDEVVATDGTIVRSAEIDRRASHLLSEGYIVRILIVEDHLDNAEALRLWFSFHDIEATVAGNCQECLTLVATHTFDLLLIDQTLPDGDGCDLLMKIALHTLTPAVALTAHGSAEDVERSKAAGFFAHVTKPVAFERLQRLIERFRSGDHLSDPERFAREFPFTCEFN